MTSSLKRWAVFTHAVTTNSGVVPDSSEFAAPAKLNVVSNSFLDWSELLMSLKNTDWQLI
jgi:hypothetical protein